MAVPVHLNRVSTAVPPFEVHRKFLEYVSRSLVDERERRLFARLASKSQIERRHSTIEPSPAPERLDDRGFFRRGSFPSTGERMRAYKAGALPLAIKAVRPLFDGVDPGSITHLIVTSCTGFYAPGLDLELQREFNLRADLERSVIGFMGCQAAFNAMKAAWHAVRSVPEAKALMVNIELCTLHMQEDLELERLLSFMQFADGCAASLISAEPRGLEMRELRTAVAPEAADLIAWRVGDSGFDMRLSPKVPSAIAAHVPRLFDEWLGPRAGGVGLWAVHPGGRAILDAVEDKLRLGPEALRASREVLRDHGNMSSATVMYVLEKILADPAARGQGVAMAFGPGLTMEALYFEKH